MKYHFLIEHEKKGYSAQCVEIDGCITQAQTMEGLFHNMKEALDLILNEPQNSHWLFPLPNPKLKGKNIIEVEVSADIAFAQLLRMERLNHGLTQHQMKDLLNFKSVYAYQKLENAKTANPTLKTLKKIKEVFADFPIHLIL